MTDIEVKYLEILKCAVLKRKTGMSQKLLAKGINVSVSTISNLENGKLIDFVLLFTYCRIVGINVFLDYVEIDNMLFHK